MKLKTSSQNDNDEKVISYTFAHPVLMPSFAFHDASPHLRCRMVSQVPAHTVRRLNDGRDRVLVEVTLPGVSGAAELIVLIRDRSISVRAPGLYNLVRCPRLTPPLV